MAGLLDALFPGADGGGLLGLLKRNVAATGDDTPVGPLGAPAPAGYYYRTQQPQGDAAAAPQQAISAPATPLMPQQAPVIPAPPADPGAPATPPAAQPSAVSGSPGFMTGYENFHNGGGLIGSIVAGLTGQRNDPIGQAQQQQAQVANVTARALIAKGVDPQTAMAAVQPGNTEALNTLFKSVLGPQNIENLGQGWIRDPRTGKVTRAYTPDEKTPQGFTQEDNGNLHFTPGGPADPAYLRLKAAQTADPNAVHVLGKGGELYKVDEKGNPTIVHKNDAGVDATLDDDTATLMAQQYLAGDKTVLQNLGRGDKGSANILKIRASIKDQADKQGLDGNAIAQRMIDYAGDTARERTAATQEGRMSPAGIEAHGAIALGRAASDAVPRGNWVPINKAIQAFQEGSSDPALRAFGSANTTIINTYARAINPNGVGTVADKEHARQMLSTADGPAAYRAVLDQLDKEIEMAHASPAQARAGFKQEREGRLNGIAPAPQAPFSAQPPPPPATAKVPALPQPGDLQGGYRFKGGNPADKSNWEQVS